VRYRNTRQAEAAHSYSSPPFPYTLRTHRTHLPIPFLSMGKRIGRT